MKGGEDVDSVPQASPLAQARIHPVLSSSEAMVGAKRNDSRWDWVVSGGGLVSNRWSRTEWDAGVSAAAVPGRSNEGSRVEKWCCFLFSSSRPSSRLVSMQANKQVSFSQGCLSQIRSSPLTTDCSSTYRGNEQTAVCVGMGVCGEKKKKE